MLKYILLGYLNYASMTGYDLKTIMEQSTSHFWHAYHSQIYTTLRKLEEGGLLVSDEEDSADKLNRRVYTITAAGQAELKNWLGKSMTKVVSIKEDLLVRLFFSGQRDRQAVLDELRIQRQLHLNTLEMYRAIDPEQLAAAFGHQVDIAHEAPFWLATLRYGVGYEEFYIRWLDEVIAALSV